MGAFLRFGCVPTACRSPENSSNYHGMQQTCYCLREHDEQWVLTAVAAVLTYP